MLDRAAIHQAIASQASHVVYKRENGLQVMHTLWQQYAFDEQLAFYQSVINMSHARAQWNGCLGDIVSVSSLSDTNYHVCGIDGSQIYPDTHLGVPAYVLNIAWAAMAYGSNAYANIAAAPYVFLQQNMVSQPYVDAMRLLYEIYAAVQTSQQAIVMLDGPLSWWLLRDTQMLSDGVQYIQQLYNTGRWYIGYMSNPQFHHISHVLRAMCEDHDVPDDIAYVTDVHLMHSVVPEWHRTRMMTTTDHIMYQYPPMLRPYFCYMNTGHEIARIEMPAWLACDEVCVNYIMACVRNQIEKGHGYPVALSEAHEAAVIRESDRQFFFEMLSWHTSHDSISQKQQLKHRPII